ncbi:MAG: hypothetical protein JEZ02_05495 [Desulfatibacillum sp.]|nr:hypothetical protein [Desulfatibacillum sp.]
MWLKFIIFAGLGYLVYKALAGPGPEKSRPRMDSSQPKQIDDVMVQDPVCKVYFPRREGVTARVDGQIIHFCSEECMEKYFKQNSKQ